MAELLILPSPVLSCSVLSYSIYPHKETSKNLHLPSSWQSLICILAHELYGGRWETFISSHAGGLLYNIKKKHFTAV